MCYGFSGFLCKDGRVFFSKPDASDNCHHRDCIDRLHSESIFDKGTIPFEYPKWTIKSFQWDTNNVPKWANKTIVHKTFRKVKPIWRLYKKVIGQAYADYEKINDQAYAKAEKIRDHALEEYEKVTDQAWAEYEKFTDQAWAEHIKVCDQARASMIEQLRKIDGFCEALKSN